ncbi:hypothetical protein P4H70_12235 [Paenibacillus ehimensis]|uniref:hypothetical protein n=1 Tax=Paenibacillus ehimensis TaxID=79264 RepID=UPI002DBD82F6|nr:hypothetical protein [Paenibacillus ehimensis]MEC0209700.1 hypothetical protein [Paenibacillus ehimensis]
MNTQQENYIKVREEANTVFLKIDDGIYEVLKDRAGTFSGRLYVSTQEVIDELNSQMKVVILGSSIIGMNSIVYKN